MSNAERPRWVKWVVIAAIVWALAMVFWLVFGGPGKTRVEEASAATNSCPHYVLVSNPVTGGTSTIDECSYGDMGSVRVGEPTQSATASSAAYGKCKTRATRWVQENKVGWDMFWIRMEKYWCWKNGKVTYAPAAVITMASTSFGASVGWDSKGVQSRGNYYSGDKWWHRSYATGLFKRCLPTLGLSGCIRIGEKVLTANSYAYGDGGWSH